METKAVKVIDNRKEEMRYLAENKEFLEAEHAGHWLALEGDKLLAIGADLSQVRKEAAAQGFPHALITAVPRREYQRRGLNSINRTVRLVRDVS